MAVGHRSCDPLPLRLFWLALLSLRRPRLIVDQIYFIGNYSLSIVTVSGLFVGFVLGLQGYYTLQRYGSSEALGLLVALSLVRELGPVVTALLFAGRAGTSLTAGIGLMKAGEQLDRDGNDGRRPDGAGAGAAIRRRADLPCRCWPRCSRPWASSAAGWSVCR